MALDKTELDNFILDGIPNKKLKQFMRGLPDGIKNTSNLEKNQNFLPLIIC